MKVKDLKKYISTLDDEEDLLCSFITRDEFCAHYNEGESLPDRIWNILEDVVGFDGDQLYYDLEYVKKNYEEDNENSL